MHRLTGRACLRAEVHTSSLPKAKELVRRRLYDSVFPLLAACFAVEQTELFVYDSLVIWYDAAHGGTRQPPHRDGSLLSCNIALSDPEDFEGGGTHFEALGGAPLQQVQGHAICHASGARHSGHPISSGTRWVLVIFVNARAAIMHARSAGPQRLSNWLGLGLVLVLGLGLGLGFPPLSPVLPCLSRTRSHGGRLWQG